MDKKRSFFYSVTYLAILLLLYSCRNKPEPQFNSISVEDNKSVLIELLLGPKDFDKQDYDLDFSSLFQSNLEGDLYEESSAWIVAFHLPEEEAFFVSHRLVFLRKPDVDINDFLVFRYKEVGVIYEINSASNYAEIIKCTKFEVNKSKECIFIKKYNDIMSILSITVRDHISDESLVEWTTPLLEVIDNRLQGYINNR